MRVCDTAVARLKRTTPQVIEALRGMDAFEIDGKLWFRLIDVARALKITFDMKKRIGRRLLNSPHAWHWRENHWGRKSYKVTLIDAEAVEDIAVMYAFVARADVMAALPRTGEKVELPATRYDKFLEEMPDVRRKELEARHFHKPGSA